MLVFIIFYGLDWVATVPPTVALCREYFGASGAVVFGWVFASHQVGAAVAATGAGLVRDQLGTYTLAWHVAGTLSVGAAGAVADAAAPTRHDLHRARAGPGRRRRKGVALPGLTLVPLRATEPSCSFGSRY